MSAVDTAVDVELAARVAHEANRAYCEATDDVVPERWHRTTLEDRASKRSGVELVLQGATPEELHGSWCARKLLEGWRYGEVKDELQRTHPCLLSYDRLPQAQRRKDDLFLAVVRALAPAQEPVA